MHGVVNAFQFFYKVLVPVYGYGASNDAYLQLTVMFLRYYLPRLKVVSERPTSQ